MCAIIFSVQSQSQMLREVALSKLKYFKYRQLRDDWQFVFLQQLTQTALATKAGWNIIVEIKIFHFWLLNFGTCGLMMKLRSIKLQKHPFHRWHTLTLTKTGAFHVHLFFFGSLQCFAKQCCICKYRRIFSILQTMPDADVLAFLMVLIMEKSYRYITSGQQTLLHACMIPSVIV